MAERLVRPSVSDAVSKTTAILFKPFSWRKWTKLIFIGWLAGSLSGGFNFSGFDRPKERKEPAPVTAQQPKEDISQTASQTALDPDKKEQIKKEYEKKYWFENSLFKTPPSEGGQAPAWYNAAFVWPVIIILVLLIVAFLWFMVWLSARFQFAWYHAVEFNDVAVGASFRKYSEESDSWMLFNIASSIIALGYFAAILLPSIYLMIQVSRISPALITSFGFMIANFWPFLLLVVFSILILVIVYAIAADFILPIMATQRVYFMEAARMWMPVYKANRAHVWRYFMMKILASIVGGVMTMAFTIPVLLLLLLVGAVVFIPLYLILMVWLKWAVLFWVLAVLLAAPYIVFFLLSMGACALPIGIFMRAYSLAFLKRICYFDPSPKGSGTS